LQVSDPSPYQPDEQGDKDPFDDGDAQDRVANPGLGDLTAGSEPDNPETRGEQRRPHAAGQAGGEDGSDEVGE
jgi:hypothetical protein